MTFCDPWINERGEIGAWDVEGDSPTYTVPGLPPGVTYDASQNLVSGAPTAAGTYTITVTANDGHSGTDEDSWSWYVLTPGTSMPFADVQFGEGPGQPGETEGVALQNPATPDQAFVYLVNPSDLNATYTVTVNTTSGGLSPDVFSDLVRCDSKRRPI